MKGSATINHFLFDIILTRKNFLITLELLLLLLERFVETRKNNNTKIKIV